MIPLRRKLPLLISALLVATVSAVGWLAYREVEGVLLASTGTRLALATRQVAQMLDASMHRLTLDAEARATDGVIREVLAHPSPTTLAAARRHLDEDALGATQRMAWEVRTSDGRLLVGAGVQALRAGRARDDTIPFGVGPMVSTTADMIYSVTVPVFGARRDTVGRLVMYRSFADAQGVDAIGQLIGPQSTLLIGNAAGDLWTDFRKAMPGPPLGFPTGAPVDLRIGDARHIGVVMPVRGAPWLVYVRSPRALALAPARQVVLNIAGIALGLVVLGTLGAWLVSNQVTGPLAEVTQAARDVARGDYARRVRIAPRGRRDELASLAESFNTMAEQVDASARDQRRHAEELQAANAELRASEERYRRLAEAAHEGICVVDASGFITYANGRLGALLGYEVAELLGRSMFDLMDVRTAFEARTRFARRLRGIAEMQEVPFQHRDGSTRWMAESVSPLFDDDGTVGGALFMLGDVTEQRALEAQLRQAQKMEAVGQLAGGIAHDFNNLLTVIGSYSEFLLAALPPESSSRTDVQEIRGAAARATNLTRQLLAFSRQQVLAPRVIDVRTVVGGMEDMLSRLVGADVRLRSVLAPDLAPCFADPGQLEQVLMNLVVNARDAMPDGGRLTIEVANATVDASAAETRDGLVAGSYVMLAVHDTGVGMDEATQVRIFEPFFTTKDVGQGTGLGLSTVYGIVRQSGGAITVESVPGEGTTVKVFLPVCNAACEAGADAAPLERPAPVDGALAPDGRSPGGVVLVVDDERWVRDIVERTLVPHGFHVLQAMNGLDALAILEDRTQRVDLVISDVTMPVLGGMQLLQHLADVRPGTRAVLMSGFTADALVRRGTLPSGAAFVGKPFTQQALLAAVAEAFRMPAGRRTPVGEHGAIPDVATGRHGTGRRGARA